jgi:hypothetical protein
MRLEKIQQDNLRHQALLSRLKKRILIMPGSVAENEQLTEVHFPVAEAE